MVEVFISSFEFIKGLFLWMGVGGLSSVFLSLYTNDEKKAHRIDPENQASFFYLTNLIFYCVFFYNYKETILPMLILQVILVNFTFLIVYFKNRL